MVFTGIIPVAKDEDGLAAILGHGLSSMFGAVWLCADLWCRDCACRSTAQCGEILVYESPLRVCYPLGSVRSRRWNREAFDNIPP